MNNEQVFKRAFEPQLTDEMLTLLYEKVLLLCESSAIKQLKGCNIIGKEFSHPLKEKVKLIYNDSVKAQKDKFVTCKTKWKISSKVKVSNLENEIFFTASSNKIISLLKHIRNAFAHNLIVIEKDKILIGDFNIKKACPNIESPTMLGNISIINFKLLIDTINEMVINRYKKS